MISVDDLERMARLAGLSVPRADLEHLAPHLQALYADLARLMTLPIAGVEPAFTPTVVVGPPGKGPVIP
jgi:Asp-tRNA(Asn)/Glu-tRNA(Gln) amidotransferase C subunit